LSADAVVGHLPHKFPDLGQKEPDFRRLANQKAAKTGGIRILLIAASYKTKPNTPINQFSISTRFADSTYLIIKSVGLNCTTHMNNICVFNRVWRCRALIAGSAFFQNLLSLKQAQTNFSFPTFHTTTMNKQMLLPGMLAITIALFGMSACTDTPAENRKEANEAVQDAKENVQDANKELADASQDAAKAIQAERDDLAAKIKRQNQEIDAEIEELDRKLEKATAKEKARWQERRKRLVNSRDDLNNDLKRVGEDMKDGWTDFKNSVASKMEKIAEDLKAE
jgi:hypothetical protein